MTDEPSDRIKIGPLIFERTLHGTATFRVEGHDDLWWQWPVKSSPDPFQSVGEQIAKAFALIDGRFEVRRFK